MQPPRNTFFSNTVTYCIAGVLLGACFPLLAAVIEAKTREITFGAALFSHENLLRYVIDITSPLLGSLAALAGRKQDKIEKISKELANSAFHLSSASKHNDENVISIKNHAVTLNQNLSEKFPLRILVAEDNHVNQLVLTGMLKKLGYEPDIATNGSDTLARTENKHYDVLLLDCHMPEMDGYEVSSQIRAKEAKGKKPSRIIAVTSNTAPNDIQRCLNAGMDEVIGKPIIPGNLIAVLQRAAQASENIFEFSKFIKRFHGFEEIGEDMCDSFLQKAPEMLEKIEVAVDSKDAAALELSAHTLKSTLSYFDYESATQAAEMLENIGATGNISKAKPILDRLKRELKKLTQSISKHRKTEKAA